jgi:hypothetical protein
MDKIVLAQNKKTDPRILAELAYDDDVQVRIAIAGNPNTPRTVLESLAWDDIREVRMAVNASPYWKMGGIYNQDLPVREHVTLFELLHREYMGDEYMGPKHEEWREK